MHRPILQRLGRLVSTIAFALIALALCVAAPGAPLAATQAFAADDIEVSISRFEDCTMLPDWDNFISNQGQYYEFNHTTQEGNPGDYEVLSADVVDGKEFVSLIREDGGWVVHAESMGVAHIKVTYRRDNSQVDESYVATVEVSDSTYTVEMWFIGSEQALPGGTVTFGAHGQRSFIDQEGNYQDSDEGLGYQWVLDEAAKDFATLNVSADDPSQASVTFADTVGDGMNGAMVTVQLLDKDNNVVASDDRWAYVSSGYCEIYPYYIDQVQLGQEFTYTPQVRSYVEGQDGYEDITSQCTFDVRFDENALQLVSQDKGTYTFKRISTDPFSLNVDAFNKDGEQVAGFGYWKEGLFYDARFERDDQTVFVKADDKGNLSGQATVKLVLDDNLAGASGLTVAWTIGKMDDQGSFETVYEQSTNSDFSYTFDAAKMLKAGAQHGVNVEARILGPDGKTELAMAGCWVEIRQEELHYDLEEDFTTVPVRFYDILADRLVFVIDEQHPEGEDVPFKVTKAVIANQTPDKGVSKVVELEKLSDGSGWKYTVVGRGKATIRLTYTDVSGASKTHDFTVTSVSEMYRVFINSDDGRYEAFPGDSIALTAEGQHVVEDSDDPYAFEGATYAWELLGDSAKYATIAADKNDSSHAVLTFNKLPEGQDEIWQDVEVSVKMSLGGIERASTSQSFAVATQFDRLWPTSIDTNFPVGTQIKVTPEVRHYNANLADGYTVEKNPSFAWRYDNQVLEVTDNKDGSYTLKRLTTNGCDYELIATWADEWGNQARLSGFYYFMYIPGPATQEMYRLYNPNSGEHFYTADGEERDHLASLGWRYEGVGWVAPAKSQTPVHRLYNPVAGEHHYTVDSAERDMLVRAGWRYEGVGWYSDDAKSVPLYRQYNPNAFACNHNYTTDKEENDFLVSLGWRYEGIGWYGVEP